ncbi:hypothetical protein [Pontibacter vulgaris]|uniref:hypothetical protein n=1 Tax=Pontibacter vulgaris TaxID=2905679 RepID=UPI001FA80BA6|nr:hypothetical protein [Pontibacter vulgaris]
MKLTRFLFSACFALATLFLYSCDCEDVYLGQIDLKGTLDSFIPEPGKGENIHVAYDNTSATIGFKLTQDNFLVSVPVRDTGKMRMHGKGAISDCSEYYSARNKLLEAYSYTSAPPFTMTILLTKNFNPTKYNEDFNAEAAEDVIHFSMGYQNTFPQPITRGMLNIYGYKPLRTFVFSLKPAALVYKPNDTKQEFIPSITLNGVQHENVYHLYLPEPQYTEDEVYLNQHYPLTYIKGIYLKEGIGVLQAYTSTGQKFNFSIKPD